MSTHIVDITGHYEAFVNQLVASGRYPDAGEVVRAGLRLLEGQEQDEEGKLVTLRALAAEGFDQLDRGEGIVIDSERKLADYIAAAGRRAVEVVEKRANGG